MEIKVSYSLTNYHGHFILDQQKLSQPFSYLKSPFDMATLLIPEFLAHW